VRVIAGAFKGRTLASPAWEGLRPTSDRLRETLFNVLAPRIDGARVLDVYAGTGAIGIEALSRGASWVTFVESDRRAQRLIEENLGRCGIEDRYAIIRAAADRAMRTLASGSHTVFDLVLLDPPYDRPSSEALAGVDQVVAPGGLVVIEHARKQRAPERAGRLERTRELPSGDSALTFYTCPP
jgi:16S rRNA (guanine966-N2)-methyltransferase